MELVKGYVERGMHVDCPACSHTHSDWESELPEKVWMSKRATKVVCENCKKEFKARFPKYDKHGKPKH